MAAHLRCNPKVKVHTSKKTAALLAGALLTGWLAGCQAGSDKPDAASTPAANASLPASVESAAERPAYADPAAMIDAFVTHYNNREYHRLGAYFSDYYWENNDDGISNAEALYNELNQPFWDNSGDYQLSFVDQVDDTHRTSLWTSAARPDAVLLLKALQEEDGNWRLIDLMKADITMREPQEAIIHHMYRQFAGTFNDGGLESVLAYLPDLEGGEELEALREQYAPLRYTTRTFFDKQGNEHSISLQVDAIVRRTDPVPVAHWTVGGVDVIGAAVNQFAIDTSGNAEVEQMVEIRGAVQEPTEFQLPVAAFLEAFNNRDWESPAVETFFGSPIVKDKLDMLYNAFGPFESQIKWEVSDRLVIAEVAVDRNGIYHRFYINYDTNKLSYWDAPAYVLPANQDWIFDSSGNFDLLSATE